MIPWTISVSGNLELSSDTTFYPLKSVTDFQSGKIKLAILSTNSAWDTLQTGMYNGRTQHRQLVKGLPKAILWLTLWTLSSWVLKSPVPGLLGVKMKHFHTSSLYGCLWGYFWFNLHKTVHYFDWVKSFVHSVPKYRLESGTLASPLSVGLFTLCPLGLKLELALSSLSLCF